MKALEDIKKRINAATPGDQTDIERLVEALDLAIHQRNEAILDGKIRSAIAAMNYERKLNEEIERILNGEGS